MISLTHILVLLGTIFLLFSLSFSAKSTKKPKVKVCPPFPHASLDHGRISVAGPQKYSFHCDAGYFLASPKQVRCWKGKWSSSRQPKCIQSGGRCDDPPPVEGGATLGDARHVGSVVQYMCGEGFMLLGEGRRHCLQSGHWSGIAPSCMDKKEPVQKVAERLKNKFVTEIAAHSSDSVSPQGRLLDSGSLLHGLELVILVDRSSSVDPVDFKKGVDFVKFLLHQFGVKNGGNNTSGTRAAVLAFGTNVDILFNLDNETITNAAAASNALNTLQAGGGGTDLEEALMSVYTRLPDLRARAKRALFVLTDGEPNAGTAEDALFFARALRTDRDFEIFTLGIGRGINRQFLAQMASEPAFNHVFVLDKYSNLMTVIQTIKDKKPKNKPISPARCGYVKSEKDHLKTWPWLSAIYIGLPDPHNEGARLRMCSGTLICSQWVLTAASCFYHKLPDAQPQLITSDVFPVLGEEDLLNDDQNQMNFYSERVVLHPDFDPSDDDLTDNLALIKLNIPAPMARFRPACLPPTDRTILLHQNLNTNASIAGWGLPPPSTSGVEDDLEISGASKHSRLSSITAVLEDDSECRRHTAGPRHQHIFCAGGGHGKKTCIGDLGSPIIAVDPSTNLHHVIGVLSSKNRCVKGINEYTEVTKYISWIDDVTEKCQLNHYMV